MLFAVLLSIACFFKISSFLNARIAYESSACSDRAYIIYKENDEQTEAVKKQDWLTRIDECAKVEAKYQQLGF